MEEIPQINETCDGCLIFLHGATRTGKWQKGLYENLAGKDSRFKHVKILFPTAPKRFFSLGREEDYVWFDVKQSKTAIIPDSNLKHLNEAAESLKNIFDELEKEGIPMNRIIVGGISQGAMVAIHAVYRYYPELAGCIAVSTMLPHEDLVFYAVRNKLKNPPLLMCHGLKDGTVPFKMGHTLFQNLLALGVPAEFHNIPNAPHELVCEEVKIIQQWVNTIIPEK